MHHALEIQEVLLNIFDHCRPSLLSRRSATPDLAALARTCRAFKEPALDALWEDLYDLSPLVRCLPEACLELFAQNEVEEPHNLFAGSKYLFSRPLTRTEWDILRSYTRRIRSIVEVKNRVDGECFITLSNPPTAEPLFPNLRYLRCTYTDEAIPLLHLPFPSLISLDLVFGDVSIFQDYLASFPDLSPNIRRLCIRIRHLEDRLIKIEPNFISRWQNLQSVVCPQITLDADALVHLSRMPALIRLTFKQIMTIPASDAPLFFHNLHHLTVHSASLVPISRLLSQIRLPAIIDFAAFIDSCPSRVELSSCLAGLQTSNAGHTIQSLSLDQSFPSMRTDRELDTLVLDLEDLRPCMALRRLRCLKLNIEWNVGLKDNDLLAMASGWPHLEHLVLNAYSGWNAPGGITLNGLVQLLQSCQSLRWVTLALDTRGYTALPRSDSPAALGQMPPRKLSLNVLDSVIEEESVLAVAAFFADILPCANMSLSAWRGGKMVKPEGWETYKDRWENVFRWVHRRRTVYSHHMWQQSSSS